VAKLLISIRLAPEQIAAASKIAAAEPVGHQVLLRLWMAEGITREAKQYAGRGGLDFESSGSEILSSMPTDLEKHWAVLPGVGVGRC